MSAGGGERRDAPARRVGGGAGDAGAIVLASASVTRRALLEAAGVPFEAEPARIDEDEIKRGMRAEGASAVEIAEVLAETKAAAVGRRHPDRMVLGADQVLDCGGETFDKPVDRARLEVREASDDFLEAYLDAAGDDAFNGPGGYRVESLGVQLFARIDGSHYTILGLPMFALLDYLRTRGVLRT